MFRKMCFVGGILSLCAGSAFGVIYNPRYVNIGNIDGVSALTRPYGISNDQGMPNGPVIAGAAVVPEGVVSFAWQNGTYTKLTDPTGAIPGTNTRGLAVSNDGTEVLGTFPGTGVPAMSSVTTDGWATHTTTALAGSVATWANVDKADNGTYGASLAAGGAGIWSSLADTTPTAVPGLTSFSELSANGKYVAGGTATGFGVHDIVGGTTRTLTPDTGAIEDVKGISHDGTWVIGTRKIGTNNASRRVNIWEWDSTANAYKAPIVLGSSTTIAAGLSDYGTSEGVAFLFSHANKTKNGVTGTHAYMAYSNKTHPTGVKLTVAQSTMWLGDHMAWAGIANPLAAGTYYAWNDTIQSASPDGQTVTGSILGGASEQGFFATLPEPSSLLLLGLGGLFLRRRR